MTKQEEISKWFCKYLAQFNGQLNYDTLPQYRKDSYKMMVMEDIMPYLHSKGVVIKVDRDLPEREWFNDWGGESGKEGYKTCYSDVMMAGYVAVEPLVKK